MRKITIITSVFLITMLGASFITAAEHETSPLLFSNQLYDGDRFEWKVRFYENDTAVTTFDPEMGFVNDSVVELEIYSNVHSIDVNQNNTEADLNAAFGLRIDGVNQPLLEDGEINMWLLLFLNPTDLFLSGSTTPDNYYYYLTGNNESHFLLNGTGEIDPTGESYRVSEERIITPDETTTENRKVWEEAEYEVGRGVLRYFSHYEEFYNSTNELVGTVDAEFYLVNDYSNGDDGMDFEFFHFVDILNTGDVYTWTVTKVEENGELITVVGADGELATDSEVKIEVIQEPEWFAFNNSPDDDPDDYFRFTVDGVVMDINDNFEVDEFLNFISPLYVDFENGTIINNFFEHIRDNPDFLELDASETLTFTADEVRHTNTRTEEGYGEFEDVSWQLNTGIMTHALFQELDADGSLLSQFELELVTADFVNPGETSGNTDVTSNPTEGTSSEETSAAALPFATYFIALSAIIAIPILRKLRY